MDEIRWEDPPPAPPRQPSWVDRLAPLMEHPKRWAIIQVRETSTQARMTANNLRTQARLPDGQWEFTHRCAGGEWRVYARYLGPDEDGTP
jgi:hypothetical protein